ncbi:unnamed protein product [Prorocentrum cordatum]|uniref:CBS domain-containing protein n=1 Tax=Prorocentrum cordatum TaxID=2364126 RepID=A0ABN9Q040_9DINO|nr:unnamed protein product [Polarella glacialis]
MAAAGLAGPVTGAAQSAQDVGQLLAQLCGATSRLEKAMALAQAAVVNVATAQDEADELQEIYEASIKDSYMQPVKRLMVSWESQRQPGAAQGDAHVGTPAALERRAGEPAQLAPPAAMALATPAPPRELVRWRAQDGGRPAGAAWEAAGMSDDDLDDGQRLLALFANAVDPRAEMVAMPRRQAAGNQAPRKGQRRQLVTVAKQDRSMAGASLCKLRWKIKAFVGMALSHAKKFESHAALAELPGGLEPRTSGSTCSKVQHKIWCNIEDVGLDVFQLWELGRVEGFYEAFGWPPRWRKWYPRHPQMGLIVDMIQEEEADEEQRQERPKHQMKQRLSGRRPADLSPLPPVGRTASSQSASEGMVQVEQLAESPPHTVLYNMPGSRMYSLFAKAGVRVASVVDADGSFCGMVTRKGLIASLRRPPDNNLVLGRRTAVPEESSDHGSEDDSDGAETMSLLQVSGGL